MQYDLPVAHFTSQGLPWYLSYSAVRLRHAMSPHLVRQVSYPHPGELDDETIKSTHRILEDLVYTKYE